jgi:hypothetical protein
MRVQVMIGAVIGLPASAVVGWAAYGATLAIAPFEGSCTTSGGIDDCVPGLSRYLYLGAAGLIGALVAWTLSWQWVMPAAFLAAGTGSIVADFRSPDPPVYYGWCSMVVGGAMVAGLVMQVREARREAGRAPRAEPDRS